MLTLELVNSETHVQVHALPRASQPAPRQNPVDEEQSAAPSHHKFQRPASAYDPLHEDQSAAPSHPKPQRPASTHIPVDDESADSSHHNLQKDGEPVQMLIRQILRDTEAADRYAKYVNRKSKEELDKPEPTDNPSHGIHST